MGRFYLGFLRCSSYPAAQISRVDNIRSEFCALSKDTDITPP
jgi:hypothetical protein